jgi:hypothetical protein
MAFPLTQIVSLEPHTHTTLVLTMQKFAKKKKKKKTIIVVS